MKILIRKLEKMKINTALILCAGYGRRLHPLTLNTPKSLLEINDLTLLENTINIIKKLNIKKIKLNTFHLKQKIKSFIEKKNFNLDIEIIDDGDQILNTGGGIYNMIKSSPETDPHFLVFNPDTIWDQGYIKTINEMIDFYFLKPNYNTLLVVDKKLSFDKNLKGDFSFYNETFKAESFYNNKLIKNSENNYIFTGCQIINRKILDSDHRDQSVHNFSITATWDSGIDSGDLFGFVSKNKFYHVTNIDIYKKLLKNY